MVVRCAQGSPIFALAVLVSWVAGKDHLGRVVSRNYYGGIPKTQCRKQASPRYYPLETVSVVTHTVESFSYSEASSSSSARKSASFRAGSN
jgi:hypothetical protein